MVKKSKEVKDVITEEQATSETLSDEAKNGSVVEYIGDHQEEDLESDPEILTEYESVPAIEAMLLASGEPLAISRIAEVTGLDEDKINDALESIKMSYESEERGFELVNVGGQFQFRTKPQYARFISALQSAKPRRLSHAALETLAIVAYRQPIVKSDIEKIRGVDATPTLKTLIDRNLIKIVGHKDTVGQPALYGTADEFLKLFGMSGLSDLPTLREVREIERDPGEVTLEEGEDEAVTTEDSSEENWAERQANEDNDRAQESQSEDRFFEQNEQENYQEDSAVGLD